MDKDTKIEILKIVGMVVVLVALIIGIVFLNKEKDEESVNEVNTEASQVEENNTDDVVENDNEEENEENIETESQEGLTT